MKYFKARAPRYISENVFTDQNEPYGGILVTKTQAWELVQDEADFVIIVNRQEQIQLKLEFSFFHNWFTQITNKQAKHLIAHYGRL